MFPIDQASSVKSPPWKSQSTQPSDAPPPTLTLSQALNGSGSFLCGRWVGAILCYPPSGSTCLCTARLGPLSLVWFSLTGGHCIVTEDLHGHSRLLPTRQCPTTLASQLLHISEPCTEHRLVAGTIFPFLYRPIPGKAQFESDLESFQGCHQVLAYHFLLFQIIANTSSIKS